MGSPLAQRAILQQLFNLMGLGSESSQEDKFAFLDQMY